MTTNTQKLADLSKFAAEFLGGIFHKSWHTEDYPREIANVWVFPGETNDATGELYFKDSDLIENFFHWNTMAPLLAHLAKREMEKRKFEWTGWSHTNGNYIYSIMKFNGKTVDGIDTNEFIALWSAIEATGEK